MSARAGQPEVLAPAGSPAALDAALLCGADAVYFGVDVLNARRNAENFTLEHLADTVRRCHVRGVKVYLTLNIVVLEQEIPQLMRAAEAACAAGVDAVIVQDAGEAAILRRCTLQRRWLSTTPRARAGLNRWGFRASLRRANAQGRSLPLSRPVPQCRSKRLYTARCA